MRENEIYISLRLNKFWKRAAAIGTVLGALDTGFGVYNVSRAISGETARSYMQANPHATATEVISDTANKAAHGGSEGTVGIVAAGLCGGILYLNRKRSV